MKKMKRFLSSLALMSMLFSLVLSEQTVEAKNYTDIDKWSYKVHIFAGKQGTFGSDGLWEDYTGKTFDINDITVKPEKAEDGSEYLKYYVKGIKPSGADLTKNLAEEGIDGELSVPTFTNLTEDRDYVVVYGIRRNMVSYTVNYLDAGGNELAPSRIYEGNVGDKPIVPYLYIEGYMPQAYNLTKTLTEDSAQNIFTFRYTPAPTGGGGGGDRTVYDEETVTTTNTTPVIVPGAGGDAAGGGVAVVPGDGGAAEAGAAGAGDAGEAAAPAEPEELVDLDDEEVPLANVPGSNGGGLGIGSEPGSFFVNMPPAVIVGVVSMAVLAVAAAWYLLFMRKKKGTGEDE